MDGWSLIGLHSLKPGQIRIRTPTSAYPVKVNTKLGWMDGCEDVRYACPAPMMIYIHTANDERIRTMCTIVDERVL